MNRAITMTLPHDLPKQEARRRIEEAIGGLGQHLSQVKLVVVEHTWQGDRLSFNAGMLGQNVRGRLDVLDHTVDIEVELPAFLHMLADVVRGRLQAEGRKLLTKNVSR